MKKIKFEKWQLILLSVFYIVFGIISAAVPRENFLTFFNVLGLLIMVVGAFSILVWFLRRGAHAAHSNQVAWGTLYIIAGILVWMRPQIIVSNYPMVFAGCVCIDSALRLQYGMDLQGMRDRRQRAAHDHPGAGDPAGRPARQRARRLVHHPAVSGRRQQSRGAGLWQDAAEGAFGSAKPGPRRGRRMKPVRRFFSFVHVN